MDYIIKCDAKIKPGTPIFFSYLSIMALTLSVYKFLEVSTRGKLLKQVTLKRVIWWYEKDDGIAIIMMTEMIHNILWHIYSANIIGVIIPMTCKPVQHTLLTFAVREQINKEVLDSRMSTKNVTVVQLSTINSIYCKRKYLTETSFTNKSWISDYIFINSNGSFML